jgi:hypothetical protein
MRISITRNGHRVDVMDRRYVAQRLTFAREEDLTEFMDKHYSRLLGVEGWYYNTGAYSFDTGAFVLGDRATIDSADRATIDYAKPITSPYYSHPDYVWLYETDDYVGKPFNLRAAFLAVLCDYVRTIVRYNEISGDVKIS